MMHFLNTSTPLVFLKASLWRDEAFSYLMARLPVIQLLSATAKDANPPLYYLILKIWMYLFGRSEVAMRTLSCVFFIALLYVLFLFMRNIFAFSSRKSLGYLLIVILNPLLHYYAFEARMYAMMAFLGTLLMYLFFQRKYRAYAVVLVLSVYTHYFLLLIPLVQAGITLYFDTQKSIQKWVRVWVICALASIPWGLFVLWSKPPVGQSFWITKPTWEHLVALPAIIWTGYEAGTGVVFPLMWNVGAIMWAILIGAFFSIQNIHRKRMFTLFIWGWGIPLLILFISFIWPIFLPRYLIFTGVGLILCMLYLIDLMRPTLRYILIAFLCLFSFVYAQKQIQFRTKAPLRTTFERIQHEALAGDEIYVVHEYDYHPALYYLGSKYSVFIYKKTYEELPWFVGKVLIPPSAMKNTLPIYPHRGLIIQQNGSISIQSKQ